MATDPVDRLPQMLSHVKFVKHDLLLRLRRKIVRRCQIRILHIQRFRLNAGPLLIRNRRPESVQTFLLMILGCIQHTISLQIIDQGEILMPFA